MAAVFTQTALDQDGYPVRDPGSSSYLATFAPAPEFGVLMAAEARRRGADHVRQLTILGDGAPWIWNLATQYFPTATQIVDLFTPASTCTTWRTWPGGWWPATATSGSPNSTTATSPS